MGVGVSVQAWLICCENICQSSEAFNRTTDQRGAESMSFSVHRLIPNDSSGEMEKPETTGKWDCFMIAVPFQCRPNDSVQRVQPYNGGLYCKKKECYILPSMPCQSITVLYYDIILNSILLYIIIYWLDDTVLYIYIYYILYCIHVSILYYVIMLHSTILWLWGRTISHFLSEILRHIKPYHAVYKSNDTTVVSIIFASLY